MVKSKLDSSVNYTEIKTISLDDKNSESSGYEVTILGHDVVIVLGSEKYTFIDKQIIYYPIYLFKGDKFSMQIGVYEIPAGNLNDIYDEDGDVDIDQLDDPLIYSFVSAKPGILSSGVSSKSKSKSEDSDEDDDSDEYLSEMVKDLDLESEEEEEEEEGPSLPAGLKKLPTQTKEMAEQEVAEYTERSSDEWIQKFMKTKNYIIIDNEGSGDCLFASIRDGLARVGINKSVQDLRSILVLNVTEDIFLRYKSLYSEAKEEIDRMNKRMKELSNESTKLKSKFKSTKDKDAKAFIIKQVEDLRSEYEKLKEDKKISSQLMGEFAFMKGVKDLDKFKELLMTCKFWGETWAISTLERVLNIKLILLSEESYYETDLNNVMQCGQLNDEILQTIGSFTPSHYIMLSYTGSHYKLITYKGRGGMRFSEIPFNIKELIVNKCLERNAGPYYIIPDFRALKEETEKELEIVEPETLIEDVEIELDNLWDESTIFQFYNRSNNKPLPGKGNGEIIGSEGSKAYSKLAYIPEWRRKLDNYWIAPFELDGHTWQTVEHYYQGSKFRVGNPQFYLQFSLDSGSEISKDPDLAKDAGGKTGKHDGISLRPKDVKIDPDFYGTKQNSVMKMALNAKYSQHPDLMEMLLETKRAKLVHFKPKRPPVTFIHLMEIRSALSKQ